MMKAEVGRIVVVVHEPELRVFGPFESRDKALVWLTQYEARTKRRENNYIIQELSDPLSELPVIV